MGSGSSKMQQSDLMMRLDIFGYNRLQQKHTQDVRYRGRGCCPLLGFTTVLSRGRSVGFVYSAAGLEGVAKGVGVQVCVCVIVHKCVCVRARVCVHVFV